MHHPHTAPRSLDPHATAARSPVREVRHPNSVTAPPVHRGSMPALPWQGFWKSVARALTGRTPRVEGADPAAPAQPWQAAAQRRRWTFALLVLCSTVLASVLFAQVQPAYESAWLGWGQIALFALLSAWVVSGFMTGMMGFWVMLRGDKHSLSARSVAGHTLSPEARTAIIMPICNEDVATVFAGLRATCESVAATGHGQTFDVFVLSDSYDSDIARAERAALTPQHRNARRIIAIEFLERGDQRIGALGVHRIARDLEPAVNDGPDVPLLFDPDSHPTYSLLLLRF